MLSPLALVSSMYPVLAAAGNAAGSADMGPLPSILFYLFAAIVLGAAFTVALAKNIVRAATGLLFALMGMVGFYFLLNAEFLAAVQLVVYVGGTLILIIFGVMLTTKDPNAHWAAKPVEVLWALGAGAAIALPMLGLVLAAWPIKPAGEAAAQVAATQAVTVESLGEVMINPAGYLAPFELVSVVLLAVMIGAAYLAKARKAKDSTQTR